MNLNQLQQVLEVKPDTSLHIMMPTCEFVPEHFHITEVGQVTKKFVDCGGTLRETKAVVLQVWVANDTHHRLKSDKLAKILKMAKSALQLEDLPVELEYESGLVSQFPLTGVEVTPGGILFHTDTKHTDCLAKDKCGVGEGCCA